MSNNIPIKLLKLRHLAEIPRSKFIATPSISARDASNEAKRKTFISFLRKRPEQAVLSGGAAYPRFIEVNCAAWISLNKAINNTVSLLLHCKEANKEYCSLIDEVSCQETRQIMLSGHATVYPGSAIEFLKLCCSGVGADYHIHIDEMHFDTRVDAHDPMLEATGL